MVLAPGRSPPAARLTQLQKFQDAYLPPGKTAVIGPRDGSLTQFNPIHSCLSIVGLTPVWPFSSAQTPGEAMVVPAPAPAQAGRKSTCSDNAVAADDTHFR